MEHGVFMEKRNIHQMGQRIHDYLDNRTCGEPSCPFIVGGTIIRDLDLTKAEFFMGIAYLIDYNRVGTVIEGRKKYYYLLGMVERYRDWRNGTGTGGTGIRAVHE